MKPFSATLVGKKEGRVLWVLLILTFLFLLVGTVTERIFHHSSEKFILGAFQRIDYNPQAFDRRITIIETSTLYDIDASRTDRLRLADLIHAVRLGKAAALPPLTYVERQKRNAPLVIDGVIVSREILETISCDQYGSKYWCESNPFNGYYSDQPLGVDGQTGLLTIEIRKVITNRTNQPRLTVGNTVKMKYSIAPASVVGTWLNSRGLLRLSKNDLARFWFECSKDCEYFSSVAYGAVDLLNKAPSAD